MPRLLFGLTLIALLAGCHGGHHTSASEPTQAPDSAVKAGTTQDSVDPRLNALQHTKRTIGAIEAKQAKAMAQAGLSGNK